MGVFLLRRLALAAVSIGIISVVAFAIIQLPPGDYVTSYIAQLSASGNAVSEQEAAALRELYGLGDPFVVQYVKWIGRALRGDLGMSMGWNRPVADLIGERLFLTMVVSIGAMAFMWLVAIPLGIYSAVKRYSLGDYVATVVGFIGLAVPNFLLALGILYIGYAVFDTNLGGLFSPEYADAVWSWPRVADLMRHLPIPVFVLGFAGIAQLTRIMRSNLLDELKKPYVITARARGLSEPVLLARYPVRVAMNPLVSTVGYLFPYVISGSIVVSLVLGLPTVGPLLLQALVAQDMFLAGAIVMMLGIATVIGTLISDLLLMWIDPRTRLSMSARVG